MGNDWASLTSTLSANARIAWAQAVVENDKVRRWMPLTRLHAIRDSAGTGHYAGREVISSCNGNGADVQLKEFIGRIKDSHWTFVICATGGGAALNKTLAPDQMRPGLGVSQIE
jgi:hypothetical protein